MKLSAWICRVEQVPCRHPCSCRKELWGYSCWHPAVLEVRQNPGHFCLFFEMFFLTPVLRVPRALPWQAFPAARERFLWLQHPRGMAFPCLTDPSCSALQH